MELFDTPRNILLEGRFVEGFMMRPNGLTFPENRPAPAILCLFPALLSPFGWRKRRGSRLRAFWGILTRFDSPFPES